MVHLVLHFTKSLLSALKDIMLQVFLFSFQDTEGRENRWWSYQVEKEDQLDGILLKGQITVRMIEYYRISQL